MKIFVSSTVKDLDYIRDELYRRLKELGYTPWFSEKDDFPINRHPDAMTNCLKLAEECDLFVVLLDKRAGLPYKKREVSPYQDLFGLTISEAEYRCAKKKGKPICIFIRKRAEHESAIYRQIIDETQRKSIKWYSDSGIYEFYERLMHEEPHVPWRYTFDFIEDLMEPLNTIIKQVLALPQNEKLVRFTFTSREAGHAEEVYVAGEFNDWLKAKEGSIRPSQKDRLRYGLKQIKEGKDIWEKDIYISPGCYDFKFVIGRRLWIHWHEDSGYKRGNDALGGPNFRIQVSIDSRDVIVISKTVFEYMQNRMVEIPSGKFSTEDDNSERIEVKINHPFLIDKYPVTQDLYQMVMQKNPSYFRGEDLPVENMSWFDAIKFCNELSKQIGLESVYEMNDKEIKINYDKNGYRLPTEAEWEYACRGGTTDELYGKLHDIAYYNNNSENKTHGVGLKKANRFGIHDMLGNVWEWCNNWYEEESPKHPVKYILEDPIGPKNGFERIVRGGSWSNFANNIRASYRQKRDPHRHYNNLGFRLVRSLKK